MPSSRDSSRRNRVAPVVKDNYNTGGKGETWPDSWTDADLSHGSFVGRRTPGGLLRMTRRGGGQRDELHARSQKPRPYPFLRQGKRNAAGYTGPTRGG